MFTNAGMNQFKDFFLNNAISPNSRVTDTQKCLRVTGKHNDLEDVGIDSYHHTMFEMLGNWSFGDYFKQEAIDWAWELLTEVYGIDKSRLYATVFVGDEKDFLKADSEAYEMWKTYLPEERILFFDRKDNFWEMGEQGPCGPCSEIHVDLRSDEDRKAVFGGELVNMDHPQVIEIWNLVFIQFNRKADGKLEDLPEKHIDTGMGFERLCMALQGKTSNYDTDIFSEYIKDLESASSIKYTGKYDGSSKSDIAMRVIVDHLRAVCFTIADGEMPSNTGAGYVIRRILRRAVRYYYSFLNIKEPLIFKLVSRLSSDFANVFPELKAQEDFVTKVVKEEEKSFLNTLSDGLKRIEQLNLSDNLISGAEAFLLYDTYGFPIDLTKLIADERGWNIDEEGFELALKAQKHRSRADDVKVWAIINVKQRKLTECNHTATHLLHAALREVLGDHVGQKGSLVKAESLRFDFSHFEKLSEEQIQKVEFIVNSKIRENIPLNEARNVAIDEARESGAMMLFGEKYGEFVRMITFDKDYSVELCGGCHVPATGMLGMFKIISETGIASGVRRIEAITALAVQDYVFDRLDELKEINDLFKSSGSIVKQVESVIQENKQLQKKIESLLNEKAGDLQGDLKKNVEVINGVNFIGTKLPISDAKAAKTLAYNLEKEVGNAVIVFGIQSESKAQLMITISEKLTKEKDLHAGNMVRELAKEIKGGGGGQAFFATAGGKDPGGLEAAIGKAKGMIS
ncbi:UNVERIFIED_CONTAM: hypothetical protein GTU68_067270 [Idotea baltica]|nr:hypothetical protein [Idotea baltica]